MNVLSALWILMAWCFSTRASVATVLTMHPCVSHSLRFNSFNVFCKKNFSISFFWNENILWYIDLQISPASHNHADSADSAISCRTMCLIRLCYICRILIRGDNRMVNMGAIITLWSCAGTMKHALIHTWWTENWELTLSHTGVTRGCYEIQWGKLMLTHSPMWMHFELGE